MAAASAENLFHVGLKVCQHLHRHKGLHRTGKTAAVHAHSALTAQIMLGSGDGHSYLLMLLVTGGDDVLQVFPAAVAGGSHHLQKGVKVALAQGSHLLGHAVVVGVEVEGAQHSAVAALLAAGRDVCKEGLKGHVPQHLAAAHSGHSAALVGDGGVLIGQVGMVCTGVQNAQRQTGLGKVHLHRLHIRVCLVGKVVIMLPTLEAI